MAAQLENGFTKIPNPLLERILRTWLSARQLKIVFAVIRLTYGFHRKTTTVSIYRLGKMTNIHRSHVSVAVRALVARNILVRKGNAIGVQEDLEAWGVRTSTAYESAPGTNRTLRELPNQHSPGGTNRHPYKETTSKEKNLAPSERAPAGTAASPEGLGAAKIGEEPAAQAAPVATAKQRSARPRTATAHNGHRPLAEDDERQDTNRPRAFIKRHTQLFQNRTGEPYTVTNWGQDLAAIRKLLDVHDEMQLAAMQDRFFAADDTDWWVKESDFTIQMFSRVANQLVAKLANNRNGRSSRVAAIKSEGERAKDLIRQTQGAMA